MIREVNLKFDNPAAAEAIRRLAVYITESKRTEIRVLKLIHGYGSSGKGGKIRTKTHETLNSLKAKNIIKDWVRGDEFTIFNPAVLKMFDVCGELRHDPDLERHNNGVSFVVL
jgi:hypothetical protein